MSTSLICKVLLLKRYEFLRVFDKETVCNHKIVTGKLDINKCCMFETCFRHENSELASGEY